MFRQEEVFVGGWHEKTIEAMLRRRFEQNVSQLPPLGANRLEALPPAAFERKIEAGRAQKADAQPAGFPGVAMCAGVYLRTCGLPFP